MTFNQLNIFCHVVEYESVTRASAKLNIPQPAATRAIRALEKEFGLPLFERSGTGIVTNDNGKAFYTYAKQILDLVAKLNLTMEKEKKKQDTTISIVVEAASHLFPQIFTAFNEQYPDAMFRALHQDAPTNLEGNDYPLRLYSSREKEEAVNVTMLAEEEIKLAVPRDGPFGNRESVRLYEVRNMGFVSLFKTRGLRQITDHYCQLAGFEPRVIFETDNTTTLTRYVHSGHGIAFIPALTWPKDEQDEHVHLLSVTEPLCRRYINLGVTHKENLSRYEVLFVRFLVGYFKNLTEL